ncbi:hypothetical protein HY312_04610 [Candidatus Saccharibacteria bacterium]|nr:hypothetical protein [Candidatus Saccharibacteria bacterium]
MKQILRPLLLAGVLSLVFVGGISTSASADMKAACDKYNTVLIGVIATGGITYGAILYASARDNQGQVQEAIGIIRNVAIGLVLYGFTVAIINWLVPGVVIG